MPGGQQQTAQFGHEHRLHQPGAAGDGFALQGDRLQLQLQVVGLLETLVVLVVDLQRGQRPQAGPVVAGIARAQLIRQLLFARIELRMLGRVANVFDGQDPDCRSRVGTAPGLCELDHCCASVYSAQRPIDGGLGMDQGGVKEWDRGMFGLHQQADLGAAQDDTLGALLDQPVDDLQVCLSGRRG